MNSEKMKIAIITGGHGFQEKEFDGRLAAKRLSAYN